MKKVSNIILGTVLFIITFGIGEITGIHRTIVGTWFVSGLTAFVYFTSENKDDDRNRFYAISFFLLAVISAFLYFLLKLME